MTITGSCFCGDVSLKITAEPVGARYCWCHSCQRIASGMATANVLFPEDAVSFTGAIGTIERKGDSGNTVERGFCKRCGSQLYSRTLTGAKQPMRVRAGILDDPEICPPTIVIWGSSAPSWAPFPAGVKILQGGPGSAEWKRDTG